MERWRVVFLLALFVLGNGSPVPRTTKQEYRLPSTITPERYEIVLQPDYVENNILGITQFKGAVDIYAVVNSDTQEIKLHCAENIEIINDDIIISDITETQTTDEPDPSTTDDSSNVTDDVSSTTDDGSSTTDDGSSTTDDDSSTTDDDSSTTDDDSSTTDDDSSTTDDDSSTTDDDSSTTDDDSSTTDDPNELKNEDPNTTDEGSNTTDEGSNTTDDGSNTTDDGSNATDDGTNATDEPGADVLPHKKINYNKVTEIVTIPMEKTIRAATKIKIHLPFEGKFVDKSLAGFYYSTYLDDQNKMAALLATQFESTSARAAFPCFDEPGLKATFDLSIAVTDSVHAISNTPQKSLKNNVIQFKQTPKMSTYLLAFIVYDKASFGQKKADDSDDFSTWARKESVDSQGKLSNTDGPRLLESLEGYTNIKYYASTGDELSMGFEKMDQAAIPDFSAGAMENWGLVTYRESALLYDEEEGSETAKKRVSQVIAHEFAHQWFGNWVTTKWWNSIWLNEGFADFFEHWAMNKIYPNWRLPSRMVLDEQMGAFDADSSSTAKSLTHDVNSPAEISAHFGTITYSKGGSILRMIQNVIGDSSFQAAIQDYLKNMQHKAAEPDDLFDYILKQNVEDTSKINNSVLMEVLNAWTTKPGYPVITVSKDGNTVKIEQDRYLTFGNDVDSETIYHVPITWVTDKSEKISDVNSPQFWLTKKNDEFSADDDWKWIIVNPYQAGYYRVDYSESLWNQLIDVLKDKAKLQLISPIDRAALINNALNLARSNKKRNINYTKAFKLMEYLRNDNEFEPWAATRTSLTHVERLMGKTNEYRDFIKHIVENAYKDMKFQQDENDDHIKKITRVHILTLACAAGYSSCLEDAAKKLEEFLIPNNGAEVKKVPADLRPVVYCYGLKGSKAAQLWEELWKHYETKIKDMTARQEIATALGCVNDETKLKQYLDASVNMTNSIPFHERYLVFSAVYSNPDSGPDVALKFLQEKGIDDLIPSYGSTRVPSLVVGLGGRITTEAQKKTLEEIVNGKGDDYAGAITAYEANKKWKTQYESDVTKGLKDASSGHAFHLATGLAILCSAIIALFR